MSAVERYEMVKECQAEGGRKCRRCVDAARDQRTNVGHSITHRETSDYGTPERSLSIRSGHVKDIYHVTTRFWQSTIDSKQLFIRIKI